MSTRSGQAYKPSSMDGEQPQDQATPTQVPPTVTATPLTGDKIANVLRIMMEDRQRVDAKRAEERKRIDDERAEERR